MLRLTDGLRACVPEVTKCTKLDAEPRLVRDIHCYLLMGCGLGLIDAGFSGILADEFDRRSLIETPPLTCYSRQDVIRILHLHPRQLSAWERAGLISPTEEYGFEQLSRLRTLRSLHATRISAKNIRVSVEAMKRVAGMRNPLMEATAVRRGSRLAFRHGGALVDPLTQQLAFDFDGTVGCPLQVVSAGGAGLAQQTAMRQAAAVQEMFLRAVRLEEDAATVPAAVETYQAILAIRPEHAPTLINLGTIHYNRREFVQAETMYRRATLSDPDYALAFFDLGNVLDEMQQLVEATAAYQRAVALVPQYADAHYNLALAYERQGQRRKALQHWLTYVRLDPVGPWAAHAQCQARKILSAEKLSIVSRRGRRVAVAV